MMRCTAGLDLATTANDINSCCRLEQIPGLHKRKGATDTKEDPGRPRGVVTRIWAGRGPP